MKKVLSIVFVLILSVVLIGCTKSDQDDNKINVGVAFYPMKDILLLIKDDLKEEGYELVINEFLDYQAPNNFLMNKELDANMIQHDYFLQVFNENNKDANLVTVQPIYHATYALYSSKYASVNEIEDTNITLPEDRTNLSRALYLLKQAGLLTFKDNKTLGLTLEDIETNPKNLTFNDRVPVASIAQKYEETGLAVMYPKDAKHLNLKDKEQRIFEELQDDVTEGYAISLVARDDNKDSEKIKALIKHITSDKVRQFLIDEYGWASSPAF